MHELLFCELKASGSSSTVTRLIQQFTAKKKIGFTLRSVLSSLVLPRVNLTIRSVALII